MKKQTKDRKTAGTSPVKPQSILEQETVELLETLDRRIRSIDGVEHLIDRQLSVPLRELQSAREALGRKAEEIDSKLAEHRRKMQESLRQHLEAVDEKLQSHRREILGLIETLAKSLSAGCA